MGMRGTVIITSLLVSVLVLSGFGFSDAFAMNKADLIASISEKTTSGDTSSANDAECKVTSTDGSIVYGSDDTNRLGLTHMKLKSPDGGDLPDQVILECIKDDADGSKTLDVKRLIKVKLTIQPENNSDSFFDVFFDVYTVDSFFDIFTELRNSKSTVDSFFDVFFDVDVGATTPDSFFDIFVDVDTGLRPDSFFDIFVDLHETDETIQTELVALDLRGESCIPGSVVTSIDENGILKCVPLQTESPTGLSCENQEAIATVVPGFEIDESCLAPDNDGDGFRADVDCDDAEPNTFPGNTEIADGIDNDCDGSVDEFVIDNDGDSFPQETDCDDAEPNAFPGNTEIADGIDNDCDGSVDEFVIDNDGDSFPQETDCDDSDPSVNPGVSEVLGDGIDNDCDGITDNLPPIVNAGLDQTVSHGSQTSCIATFVGTASDPDFDPLSIQWSSSFVARATVDIGSPNSLTTDVTITPDSIGIRTATLTLTVNDGFHSSSDSVLFTCTP